MYDIDELEKKWIKYRRRKITLYTSVTVLTLSIIGGSIYLISSFSNNHNSNEVINKNTISKRNSKNDKDIIVKRKRVESSSMGSEVPSMQNAKNNQQQNSKEESIEQPKVIANNNQNINYHKPRTLDLVIKDPQNGDIVKEIENRFAKSKSYDDAIYLAEYYYSKNNYKKAEYWAMQANIINSLPEESWLIFAKSKVKSGHRVEALKVLQAYYDKTGSTTVLDLIDLIRKNGNF